MKRLGEWLWRACGELGLRVELGFELSLPGFPRMLTVARIPDLGGKNGMLIFSSYDDIQRLTKEIVEAGYGFSVLDDPDDQEKFDLDSFRSMFLDWGWSGKLGAKPKWMR